MTSLIIAQQWLIDRSDTHYTAKKKIAHSRGNGTEKAIYRSTAAPLTVSSRPCISCIMKHSSLSNLHTFASIRMLSDDNTWQTSGGSIITSAIREEMPGTRAALISRYNNSAGWFGYGIWDKTWELRLSIAENEFESVIYLFCHYDTYIYIVQLDSHDSVPPCHAYVLYTLRQSF